MKDLQFAIVATDILIMRNNLGVVEIATQQVHRPPHYVHIDGFIGGVLHPKETAEAAAKRIISEKTSINTKRVFYTPLKFYDRIDRDKRGRVISIAYIGIMDTVSLSDEGVQWIPARNIGHLAYDHDEMRRDMFDYMKHHLFITNIALRFMPQEFTIAELKTLYEYLLGKGIDKRNFYKFAETLPIKVTKKLTDEGRGRPAKLYAKLPLQGFYLV